MAAEAVHSGHMALVVSSHLDAATERPRDSNSTTTTDTMMGAAASSIKATAAVRLNRRLRIRTALAGQRLNLHEKDPVVRRRLTAFEAASIRLAAGEALPAPHVVYRRDQDTWIAADTRKDISRGNIRLRESTAPGSRRQTAKEGLRTTHTARIASLPDKWATWH